MRLIILFLAPFLCLGNDIYVAQTAQGGNTGADCADALIYSYFNSSGNWQASTGTGIKIGYNTTVHLCGTLTGTAGATWLTAQGNGSSGSPVTIKFETGAVMTAPYWGSATSGAINIVGYNYFVIDGGVNGEILNSANGTALANQKYSTGIYIQNATSVEVKNLSITGIYANGGSSPAALDAGGMDTADILAVSPLNTIIIHNNTLSNARAGAWVNFDGSSLATIQIYSNYINDHDWGIVMGAGSGGETTTGVSIYNNEITDWANWQCPAYPSFLNYCSGAIPGMVDVYHTDGIILFSYRGSPITASIYNNYLHGTLGSGSPTAFIFCTEGGGSAGIGSTCNIFNNVLAETSGPIANWILATGVYTGGHQIYNNTIVGQGNSGGIAVELNGTSNIFKNNIISGKQFGMVSYEASPAVTFSSITQSDNNVWYNLAPGSEFSFNDGGTYYSYSAWTGLGYDTNSLSTNPNLSGTYTLQSGSSAIGAGANLTTLGITSLDSDYGGAARPPSGAWTIGAYNYIPPPGSISSSTGIASSSGVQ